jgi:hypothetical protein
MLGAAVLGGLGQDLAGVADLTLKATASHIFALLA